VRSLSELLERCSRRAGEAFHRDLLRAMVWLAQNADGELEAFDQPCSAPHTISDRAVLEILCAEMRAEFAYDDVVTYAVAYVGTVTFTGVGCAILAKLPSVRRRVVVVEAYDARASVVATRDIVRGEWPRLGPLQKHERATPRFGGLLAVRTMEAS
jgi:hypothetical protein